MEIKRIPSNTAGRSIAVSFNNIVWLVSNAVTKTMDLKAQAMEMFELADKYLGETGSSKERLLSVQIFLSDMNDKNEFDLLWSEWIGNNPQYWPQRLCIEAKLDQGLLVEIQVVAAVK